MRKFFTWLPQSRGKRLLAIFGLLCAAGLIVLVVLGVTAFFLFRSPRFQAWFFPQMMKMQLNATLPDPPAVPPGPAYAGPTLDAASVTGAGDLFIATNIWQAHLRFTQEQWDRLGPKIVRGVPDWVRPDGKPKLHNPEASRAGIAGVFGIDLVPSEADFEFGGARFTNVAVRFKGNGTFLTAMQTYKRPYKVTLDKHVKGQSLAGRATFNFGNLVADQSFLSDTLGYEYFREAGVPAPLTTFVRLFLTIEGKFEERLLGLYLSVENPDAAWVKHTFPGREMALFKPVTHELFEYLGPDWQAYEPIYDPKTKITPAHQQRVVDLSRLVSRVDDAEFARRIGEYLDLEACARYFAAEVLLAHYDGILAQGQNFLAYLDGATGRFGFAPWDLDHAWGEFPLIDTADNRERASISRPWEGRILFLERLFAVQEFDRLYRAELERQLETVFRPDRLGRRIDELAAAIRSAIAEESLDKLAKFEIAVSSTFQEGPREGSPFDPNRPVFQLKRFIEARARNVREQLEGRTEGVIITRRPW